MYSTSLSSRWHTLPKNSLPCNTYQCRLSVLRGTQPVTDCFSHLEPYFVTCKYDLSGDVQFCEQRVNCIRLEFVNSVGFECERVIVYLYTKQYSKNNCDKIRGS